MARAARGGNVTPDHAASIASGATPPSRAVSSLPPRRRGDPHRHGAEGPCTGDHMQQRSLMST
eukprot:366493-Chlamydomonas_euryale.AAC.9